MSGPTTPVGWAAQAWEWFLQTGSRIISLRGTRRNQTQTKPASRGVLHSRHDPQRYKSNPPQACDGIADQPEQGGFQAKSNGPSWRLGDLGQSNNGDDCGGNYDWWINRWLEGSSSTTCPALEATSPSLLRLKVWIPVADIVNPVAGDHHIIIITSYHQPYQNIK